MDLGLRKLHTKSTVRRVKISTKEAIYKDIKVITSKMPTSMTKMKTLTSSLKKKNSFGTIRSTISDRNHLNSIRATGKSKGRSKKLQPNYDGIDRIHPNLSLKTLRLFEERRRIQDFAKELDIDLDGAPMKTAGFLVDKIATEINKIQRTPIRSEQRITFAGEAETLRSSNTSRRSRGKYDSNQKQSISHTRRKSTIYQPKNKLRHNNAMSKAKSGELEVILKKFKKDVRRMSTRAKNVKTFKRRDSQVIIPNQSNSPFLKNREFFNSQKDCSPRRQINFDKKINNFINATRKVNYEDTEKNSQESTDKFTDGMFNNFVMKSVSNHLHRMSEGSEEVKKVIEKSKRMYLPNLSKRLNKLFAKY
ncbi:unnamed protein product [Moneuplotes crassus]|uniref:Uncharacterized protein n=1 Tax=Euplotes crassus TaxID=5936 RepID=A0AAD1UG26_EUPCR|nr:unnamed protein product [Moneuplotes crassus]